MSPDLNSFRAFRIHRDDDTVVARFETLDIEQLSPGDVVIRVSHSSINYKDALAATGAGRILRRFPLVGGVDLAGTVHASTNAGFRVGDAVLVTGCDLSETRDGGYAQYARVPADAVVHMPPGFDAASAMAVGSAGFAAALSITRMEMNGQQPDQGPVVVTGAAGGVGSLAIDMLAGRGYQVIAVTGKSDAHDYLRSLGASEVTTVDRLGTVDQPLLPARWGGGIDNLGGPALARLIAGTVPRGNVAAVGLAASAQLNMTVMPFILRGVNLLGINSTGAPRAIRERIWERIASDLKPSHLDLIANPIDFDQLPDAFPAYLKSGVRGRTVVRIP